MHKKTMPVYSSDGTRSTLIPHGILFILFLFFLSSCVGEEYHDHFTREHTLLTYDSSSGPLSGEMNILPDVGVLEDIVKKIDNARSRIWVETYIWTEKKTRDAIIGSHGRGLDVRVLLERNVYNTPRINDSTVSHLVSSGVLIKFTGDRYAFTHMKLWIIDDEACISTGNWTYTSFTKNRELVFCTRNSEILRNVEEIFLSDFSHKRPIFSGGLDNRIGLAPENLRLWLTRELEGAKESIIVYNQSITDPEILMLLSMRKDAGIRVELCQAKSDTEGDRDAISSSLEKRISAGPYLHAKAIIIDGQSTLLGSANLTKNAIDNNREIMFRIENNSALAKEIYTIYQNDCNLQG